MAMERPGWERAILRSEMRVEASTGAFKAADQFVVTLTRRDGTKSKKVTGAVVKYRILPHGSQAEKIVTVPLVVESITKDKECNVTQIFAHLPQKPGVSRGGVGARFSLVLEDHSVSTCDQGGEWVARLRQGFGWCGTGDSTATLLGRPEPVVTIADQSGL